MRLSRVCSTLAHRMRRSERIGLFTQEIWAWYDRHKRVLPWRDLAVADDTQRAYMILVSEVMLQQTQVPRVIVIFNNFLRRFPTLASLAIASSKDVILAWRGMGYNSRALRLRDAARTILTDFGGVFPCSPDALLGIKGIGSYTAAALRNFAFGIPTPCIDTNIRRILHRVFVGPENPDGTWPADDVQLLRIASEVLEVALAPNKRSAVSDQLAVPRDAANWHAALMDFGSLVCTKRLPRWDVCPLTAAGIMKTTAKNLIVTKNPKLKTKNQKPREPGRLVGSVFIPNRIFRGRIVEQLRDAPGGLGASEIGKRLSVDWNARAHRRWLDGLLEALKKDGMLAERRSKFTLAE